MQIYVSETFFSTSITNYLCLVQQHLIGTPFQLRISRFSFFHIDWKFSITQRTFDCITIHKIILTIQCQTNISHISSKSRFFIQIICRCFSEVKSKILSIRKYIIYNVISITYKYLTDQNSKIDYLLTTEDNRR